MTQRGFGMILRGQDSARNTRFAAVRAPAKLNLCLDVLGRRDDGYHELETLMVPLRLHDSVAVQSTPTADRQQGKISLRVDFPGVSNRGDVPLGRDNLVCRSVEALRHAAGIGHGARIHLVKRIPSRAGLGGGSSDAAAALVAANAAWDIGWNRAQLSEIAAEIGSDVPFFLAGGAAVCRGRGERVAPVRHATPLHVVVVQPPVGLATADIFRSYTAAEKPSRKSPKIADAVAALTEGKLADLGRSLFNRLETAASGHTEWIERVAHWFEKRLDVIGHSMTGSGAAYFGICRNAPHARRIASVLRAYSVGWTCATQAIPSFALPTANYPLPTAYHPLPTTSTA